MRITVASGKGGTGKTTVAVSLALALALRSEESVQLVDADVEEPNAHLFLKPHIDTSRPVEKRLPRVDEVRCDRCGACVAACEFNALALLGKRLLVYGELCHGCGRCGLVCPRDAIREVPHGLGVVETGTARGLRFAQGRLKVGESMATPVVQALKEEIVTDGTIIVDAPPGTGCPTIAALQGADLALLVTEPTPFGLHDLRAAVEVTRKLRVPAAVIVNRTGIGDGGVEVYCRAEGLPIVLSIPFDRAIAAAYAVGEPLVDALPGWRARFAALGRRLTRQPA